MYPLPKDNHSANTLPGGNAFVTTCKQVARYGLNCCVVLAAKVALIILLTRWMAPSIAYLFIHVIIFFLSYVIHARHTFNVGHSWQGLRMYFSVVIGFKMFDYILFNVLLIAFSIDAPLGILIASGIEALAKFFVVRKAMNTGSEAVQDRPPNGSETTGQTPCERSGVYRAKAT